MATKASRARFATAGCRKRAGHRRHRGRAAVVVRTCAICLQPMVCHPQRDARRRYHPGECKREADRRRVQIGANDEIGPAMGWKVRTDS